MYHLRFDKQAILDIAKLKRSEPMAFAKVSKLLAELREHPYTGTGKPKRLSGNRSSQWSRRISDKHRLVYSISEETVVVIVVAAWGHYDAK